MEGLGGGARAAEPRGQRRRPCAPVFWHYNLAARCDPRQRCQAPSARRRATMSLVSGMAAAADAPAQAYAIAAQGCFMLQAQCALSTVAPLAGGCAAELRAKRSWAAPEGASCRMAGHAAPLRRGRG